MSVKSIFTALADQVRRLSGSTDTLSVEKMTEALAGVKLGADADGLTAGTTDVIDGKTFIGDSGERQSGKMANNGAVNVTLDAVAKSYTIAAGYHNGNGKVKADTQAKEGVPGTFAHTVYPDDKYFLSSVKVLPGAYTGTLSPSGASAKIDLDFTPGKNDQFFMFIDMEVPIIFTSVGGFGNSVRDALFIRRVSESDVTGYDLQAASMSAPNTNKRPVTVEYASNSVLVGLSDGGFKSGDTYRWVLIRR